MDDLIESVYSCIRCGDETCGGECCDPRGTDLLVEDSVGSEFGKISQNTSISLLYVD